MLNSNSNTQSSIDIIGAKELNSFFKLFLTAISLFLYHIICKLSTKMRSILQFYQVPLNKATHVILKNQYGGIEIYQIECLHIHESHKASYYESLLLLRHIDPQTKTIKVLDTPYNRFIFDFKVSQFICPDYSLKVIQSMNEIEKKVLFGLNMMEMKNLSFWEIFDKNFFEITFLWELAAVFVWIWISYLKYATIVGSIYFFIFLKGLYDDWISNYKIKLEIEKENKIKIKKKFNNEFQEVSYKRIFPGDIILIETTKEFKCDAQIVKGDVIIDESFLTGESIPICKGVSDFIYAGPKIIKSSCEEEMHCNSPISKLVKVKNLLGCHSENLSRKKINISIKTEMHEQRLAEAIVIKTGRKTKKGMLMKNLLIKNPPINQFKDDAFLLVSICLHLL